MIRLLGLLALLHSRFKPLLNYIGLVAVRMLSTTVRMKRLVFIVSLFAHVKKIDACRLSWYEIRRITGELNCNLHLTHNQEGSLALPLFIHGSLWDGDFDDDVKSGEHVVECSPSWLRYNHCAMVEDAKRVLTISAFTQAA